MAGAHAGIASGHGPAGTERHPRRFSGAPTPEDLETSLEDALLLGDLPMVMDLFEEGAILVLGDGASARGGEAIARLALATWERAHPYLAAPRHVVQAGDLALLLTARGANVARRRDGSWHYAIALQSIGDAPEEGGMTDEGGATGPSRPVAVSEGEGEARWWLGSLAVIKATAADTGGQVTVIEVTEPPSAEAPWHVHHREDEGFWLLDGDATFTVGETTIQARAGHFVFGPRGVPHRYTAGASGCRMLFILTPGGFERLLLAMSEPAGSRDLPPPSTEEPDWERVAAIAREHGVEVLG